jgi:predicted nuclease of predicted toxin-antitoxin system
MARDFSGRSPQILAPPVVLWLMCRDIRTRSANLCEKISLRVQSQQWPSGVACLRKHLVKQDPLKPEVHLNTI